MLMSYFIWMRNGDDLVKDGGLLQESTTALLLFRDNYTLRT